MKLLLFPSVCKSPSALACCWPRSGTVSSRFKLYASKLRAGWYDTCDVTCLMRSSTLGLAVCLLRYRDFLPRGSGIVTRRPLVLQLMNCPTGTDTCPFVQVFLSSRLFWTCCFRLVTDLMRIPTYYCSYLLLPCYEPCLQVSGWFNFNAWSLPYGRGVWTVGS